MGKKTEDDNGKSLVLIVEDDRVYMNALMRRLATKHCTFEQALNPDQAVVKIDTVGRENIAVAIVDMRMPPLGDPDGERVNDAGLAVVEKLRGNDLHREYPQRGDPIILVFTFVDTMPQLAEKCERLGAKYIDKKNLDLFDKTLVAAVQEWDRINRPSAADTTAKAIALDPLQIKSAEERGAWEATQQVLARHLTRQFGEMPSNIGAKLGSLSREELDAFDLAMFDFNSYADVEAWFKSR